MVKGAGLADDFSRSCQSSAAHDFPVPSSPSNAATPWLLAYQSSSRAFIAVRETMPYSLSPEIMVAPEA